MIAKFYNKLFSGVYYITAQGDGVDSSDYNVYSFFSSVLGISAVHFLGIWGLVELSNSGRWFYEGFNNYIVLSVLVFCFLSFYSFQDKEKLIDEENGKKYRRMALIYCIALSTFFIVGSMFSIMSA